MSQLYSFADPDFDVESAAIKCLEAENYFPPEFQSTEDKIVYVFNLPEISEDKHQNLLKNLVTKLINPVISQFKKDENDKRLKQDQVFLNKTGFCAVIRFLSIEEAREFVRKWKDSTFFGERYGKLEVMFQSQYTKLMKLEEPRISEFNQVNLFYKYDHLLKREVMSQFAIRYKDKIEIQQFQAAHGVAMVRDFQVGNKDLHFSPKGSFLFYLEKQSADDLYDQLLFFVDKEKPIFEISVPKSSLVTLSSCERFVLTVQNRLKNNRHQFAFQVYSTFEQKLLFEQEYCNNSDKFEGPQVQIAADGSAISYFKENLLIVQEIKLIDGIYQLSGLVEHKMFNCVQCTWGPVGALLTLFQQGEESRPSTFTIINPHLDMMSQKIINRPLHVDSGVIVWQSDGCRVSLVTEAKVKLGKGKTQVQTQIFTYTIRTFKDKMLKLDPGLRVKNFCYNKTGDTCAFLTEKERKGGEFSDANIAKQVFTMNANDENAKPEHIVGLEGDKVQFCQLKDVFVVVSKVDSKHTRLEFVDSIRQIKLNYFVFQVLSMQWDTYERYLIVHNIIANGSHQINIIDCVGSLLYQKTYEQQINELFWRPEDLQICYLDDQTEEIIKTQEEIALQEYAIEEQTTRNSRSGENAKKNGEKADRFAKLFMSQEDIQYCKTKTEKMHQMIKSGYPEFEIEDLKPFQTIMLLERSKQENTITRDEFNSIKEAHEVLKKDV